VTGFRSFDNSTGKRVLNLLQTSNLRLRNYSNRVWSERWRCQWWKLWWNRGKNHRTGTTKLSDTVIAGFGVWRWLKFGQRR